jgi:hypothetical protein
MVWVALFVLLCMIIARLRVDLVTPWALAGRETVRSLSFGNKEPELCQSMLRTASLRVPRCLL